jgi:hypothetical protein
MRVCILIEDGYTNFNPDYYLHDHLLTTVIMEPPVIETLRSIRMGMLDLLTGSFDLRSFARRCAQKQASLHRSIH